VQILLAEDDVTLQRGLKQVLLAAGYQVTVAEDGPHADRLLAAEEFDLLVLDLGLPQLDGLTVLERLRRRRQGIPVLIISARDQAADRVAGLNIGADDYLTKPFDLSEFEARVRALLRRGQGAETRIGTLVWSWTTRQAWIDGEFLTLSQRESTMLESLLQSPEKIISKQVLARRMGDDDAAALHNTVEVYVHRLRRKLAEAGVTIHTVRGLGYVLREEGGNE